MTHGNLSGNASVGDIARAIAWHMKHFAYLDCVSSSRRLLTRRDESAGSPMGSTGFFVPA
jgi:hypothetical protein